MRVATWEDIRTVELTAAPPPAPGPGDIVIDVALCGICGSDVHSFAEGGWTFKGMALGHEIAGTISQVGAAVTGLVSGDRVTINPAVYCGNCDRCHDNRSNLCADMTGSGGGFSDQVLVHQAERDVNVFVLPDDVPFEAGAFLEPMAVAMRAVRELDPPLDEPIAVTGLGSIGQCVVQILAALGAKTIVAIETSAVRREAAVASGATEALDPLSCDVVAELIERYGSTSSPYRPDSGAFGSAFECAGAAPVFDQLFQLVRAAGSISLIALTARPVTLDPNRLVQKEIRVLGSFAYTTADMEAAFALIASRKVRPETLISHRFALADVQEAFEVQCRSDVSVKVMIHP